MATGCRRRWAEGTVGLAWIGRLCQFQWIVKETGGCLLFTTI
ncbi:hypothetical protein NEISICOT_02323 [Neisseria sicca ATCC 29256]|uniref:Uncharacterized protein n=1 Tax=Neisseria sicca ATCC 29256 TaxID=547045 RepID=C6M720_NEISI|nr:hypothetical protein NEISICOT_02323 [Neisseria sicca ATCC 29256]